MFGYYNSSASTYDLHSASPTSYGAQIRIAHALADMLKRTRPHLFEQIEALQTTIRNCQDRLDRNKDQIREATRCSSHDGHSFRVSPASSAETRAALQELEEALQSLMDLRHKGQMAK